MSSPRPLRIRSDVPATLPPLRCRSQAMLRRSSCGNMELIWVICAGSTARLREEPLLLLPPEEEDMGLLRYQRMAKKPTSATARSWGMLIEVSVWAIFAVTFT